MGCFYNYKGHIFNSEVELDDFLIEKRQYESELGDIVFSQKNAKNRALNTLKEITKDLEQVRKKTENIERTYDEFGNASFEKPPYMGVNRFLSEHLNEEGKQLLLQFRPDEYWKRRYIEWKLGNFSDDEIELFELDPDHLPAIISDRQMKEWRQLMEEKWQAQGKMGTAVHEILKICFFKTDKIYAFTKSQAELVKYVKDRLSSESKKNIPNYDTDDSIIIDAINHAKTLASELTKKLGDDLSFYPEFIISLGIKDDKCDTLVGIVDLLIVDKEGKIHILDYKTSIHQIHDDARRLAYRYLLAVYLRMFEKYGLNVSGASVMITPLHLKDFRKEGDSFTYSGVDMDNPISELDLTVGADKIWDNIEEFIPKPFVLKVDGEEIGKNVKEAMEKWVPGYSSTRTVDRESVKDELEKNEQLKPDENGDYIFKIPYSNDIIKEKEPDKFVDAVLKHKIKASQKRIRYTETTKKQLKEAIKNKDADSVDFPESIRHNENGSATYIKDQLALYCNGYWEVVDDQILESYGIIMVKTKDGTGLPPRVDFIRISTEKLDLNFFKYLDRLNKRAGNNLQYQNKLSIIAHHNSDISEHSKSDSLILLGVKGNIELMETMLILNYTSGLENATIGRLVVLNPDAGNGMEVSNEELLYNFNLLDHYAPLNFNNFNNGKLKLASKFDIVRQHVYQIMSEGADLKYEGEYGRVKELKSAVSIIDKGVEGDAELKIKQLQELLNELNRKEVKLKTTLSAVTYNKSNRNQQFIDLYNEILIAIADLKGIKFRQQLEDHDRFLESAFIATKGISGSYIDNPGNLNSATLNLLTKLVTEAYQNTRDDMQRERVKIYNLVEKLKKEKGMSALSENTFGNQTSLYERMYKFENGEWMFVDPNTLAGAEKEFLEFTLRKINKDRHGVSDEELEERLAAKDPEYYKVPLALGGLDSISTERGLLAAFRDKLSYFIPKVAYKRAREKMEGIFNADSDEIIKGRSALNYTMTNLFDENKDKRKNALAKGVGKYEHNLETLLYKHIYAYSAQRNINAVFPMIKAAVIHIANLGFTRNTKYSDDIKYAEEYIQNKILNQTIVEPSHQGLVNGINVVKQAASTLTLALAPVQMFYQPLQSLWQNISLMIRKPDGKNSFTFSHFRKSYGIVYRDFLHYSDKPTLCSSFNELYGINDMDMNVYAERLSTGKKGIWNMGGLLFKFATRPDYYNRMTIFLSQMLGDGCLEAHSMENGQLKYDISKDKRFKDWWANKNGNTPEINQLRSLYYTMAKLFVQEGVKNLDGSDFILDMKNPMPLPRAYTNKEAEGMKSLADDIYGYYSHEKKSLIQSTIIGSMWLQFKTYWSGKKNQFFQSGGVRMRGEWIHYEENGKKYYYQVDENGNVDYNAEPLPEGDPRLKSTVAPVMQWKGRWQEGIMLTLSDMAKLMWDKKSITAGWNVKWNNEDPMLQLVYRSNIKQTGYDLMMFALGGCILSAILGDLLDDMKKTNKERNTIESGLATAAANIAIKSVQNSFLDFNILDSVGTPVGQWTPFAYSWGSNTVKNWYNVAIGDEDFWDGVVKSSGGLKLIKPLLDVLKPEMFRTEREGGTFGVE